MDKYKLADDLRLDEGFRSKPYKCTAGKLTIGYGRNIEDRGITKSEADYLLLNDIERVHADLDSKLPWFKLAPEHVQRALCNMAFQLGTVGLLKFKNTLALIADGKYDKAADEAMYSAWAKQTPNRAKKVTDLLRGKPK